MTKGNITVFIHPNSPYLHFNGTLIDANPSKSCIHLDVTHRTDVITALYPSGMVELYFDTARTLMDLILSGTVQNYTSIMYQISHTGDSFPSIIDRFLATSSADTAAVYKILQTRFWWDRYDLTSRAIRAMLT
jgi:hypothetical protein